MRAILAITALLALFVFAGMAPAKAKASDAVCEVSGFVTAIEKVERSAWADGAPSPFSTVETRITLKIGERLPHDNTMPAEKCALKTSAPTMVYKLCSPTQVKVGDTIHAIEGVETGSSQALGCLFDVSVKQS